MKLKHLPFAIILPVVVGFSLTGCERVEPNQAGVLMENYGRNGKGDFSIVSRNTTVPSPTLGTTR